MSNKNAAFFDIKPLHDFGFTRENTQITIKVKDGTKKYNIDLSDTGQIKPYYNIDDEVKKDDETGQPTFSSIDKIAKELLENIKPGK